MERICKPKLILHTGNEIMVVKLKLKIKNRDTNPLYFDCHSELAEGCHPEPVEEWNKNATQIAWRFYINVYLFFFVYDLSSDQSKLLMQGQTILQKV